MSLEGKVIYRNKLKLKKKMISLVNNCKYINYLLSFLFGRPWDIYVLCIFFPCNASYREINKYGNK